MMDLQLNGSVRDPEMPKMTAVCSEEQGAQGFIATVRPSCYTDTTY